jgi:hypothetical protein
VTLSLYFGPPESPAFSFLPISAFPKAPFKASPKMFRLVS